MTSLKQIPIATATDDQLVDYAERTLQLDIEQLTTRGQIIAAIGNAWPNDWIMVDATPEDEEHVFGEGQDELVETDVQQRLTGSAGQDDPVVIVTIGQTEQPGGRDPVPIGHNGNTIIVQRGLKAAMPYRFFLNLQNAVRHLIDAVPIEGQPGKYNLVESEVSNYPIAIVHQMPTVAEIREWHARVDNLLMP